MKFRPIRLASDDLPRVVLPRPSAVLGIDIHDVMIRRAGGTFAPGEGGVQRSARAVAEVIRIVVAISRIATARSVVAVHRAVVDLMPIGPRVRRPAVIVNP